MTSGPLWSESLDSASPGGQLLRLGSSVARPSPQAWSADISGGTLAGGGAATSSSVAGDGATRQEAAAGRTPPPAVGALSPIIDAVGAEPQGRFECSLCGARVLSQVLLARHARTHGVLALFACRVCGSPFTERALLVRHAQRHAGERPAMCGVCGRTFAKQRSRLTTHLLQHDGRCDCAQCGDTFQRSAELKRHAALVHGAPPAPVLCEVCGRSFSKRDNLTEHRATHDTEKRFACSACDKRFTTKRYLTKHMRTHERRAAVLEQGTAEQRTSATAAGSEQVTEHSGSRQRLGELVWTAGIPSPVTFSIADVLRIE